VATAYGAVVAAIAVGLVLDVRLGGWTAGAVTGVVVELGGADAQSLAGRLGRVLGDPSLALALARDGAYVDEAGQPVRVDDLPPGRAVLPIADDGEVIAYVVHDAAVLEDAVLVDAVASATRIAVANLRLRGDVDAGARAIAASQRRVISAADDQRRRMGRRVAAGPIARLERAWAHVELATRHGGDAPPNDAAIDVLAQVEAATGDLRIFALGLYPATLSADGLVPAVRALAAATPLPVTVEMTPVRLPEAIEAGAYFVCAEAIANAVKHAQATRVLVEGRTAAGSLQLAISDDGVGGADPEGWGLRGLRDRVALLGGTLTVTSPTGGGTRVEAVLPLSTPTSGTASAVSPPAG
jgi:signal transduction histidine kinase